MEDRIKRGSKERLTLGWDLGFDWIDLTEDTGN
jgi:hypothetical protein